MNDDELIETFRKRAQSWAWNDDTAWVKVKLGEMRAILRILDAALSKSNPNTPERNDK